MITIVVHGEPVPQGSMIKNQYGALYSDNAKVLKPWRKAVTAAAVAAIHNTVHASYEVVVEGAAPVPWQPITGPAAVTATFTYVRPTSHYRTGRNAHLLRDGEVTAPIKRGLGDLDKCVRACLDALTDAGVWVDDAQVCKITAEKVYGTEAGVTLHVVELDVADALGVLPLVGAL